MDDRQHLSHGPRFRPGFWRVVGSLALSALLCSLAMGGTFTALKLVQDGQGLDGWSVGIILYSLVALFFALPIALLLGGPLYYLMSRRNAPTLVPLMLAAGVLAVIPFLIIGRGAFSAVGTGDYIAPLSIFLFAIGCAGGAVFWKLAGLKNRRRHGEGH